MNKPIHSSDDSFDDRAPLGANGRPHYVELPVDDICPGKLVTPCSGPFQNNLHMFDAGPVIVKTEDRRFHGYPMMVLAVDLPFVSVQLLAACPQMGIVRFAYDVRDVQFREVSQAYTDSLVNGVVDQGGCDGRESTNPHPAPKDMFKDL